jgi:predicted small integral membrane protein
MRPRPAWGFPAGFVGVSFTPSKLKKAVSDTTNPSEAAPTSTPPPIPITMRKPPADSPFKPGLKFVFTEHSRPSEKGTRTDEKAEEAPNGWTLKFQSGIKVSSPTLARIVSAIENLQPDEADRNGLVILETTRSDRSLAIFLQVCCYEQGIYLVEIGENKPVGGTLSSLLKAGRREATGAVVSESDVKTYENETLSTKEVIAIAEQFFLNQECDLNFQWRSIREDVEAFHQGSRKQPYTQNEGQKP